MINKKIIQLMNKQINVEFYSSYLYYSMSSYCNKKGLKGFTNWMCIQAREELAHGNHLFQYLLDRGVEPQLMQLEAPPQTFEGLKEIFEQLLQHEQYVTEEINHIASIALEVKDHGTYQMMQWYVTEQMEEESTAETILQKLYLIGNDSPLIYNLDSELATRTFVDPFAAV